MNRFGILLLLLVIGGCATPALNRVDADNASRKNLIRDANLGDANAQYLLAESFCCGAGFYSTSEAIKWWCRASAQGHARATERLHEHVDGEIIAACKTHDASDNYPSKDI